MKIGIDLDGVVIDSEQTFRTYEEIYDVDILKGNHLVNQEEPKFQARYHWTKDQEERFIRRYFLEVSRASNLMAGFEKVYHLLKEQGNEFIVISARGGLVGEMKGDAIRLLKEHQIEFDQYYWKVVENLAKHHVKTLYFRDVNLKKMEESEYLTEVSNWGEVYRYIRGLSNLSNESD